MGEPTERVCAVYEGGFLTKAWVPPQQNTRTVAGKVFYRIVHRDRYFRTIAGRSLHGCEYLKFIQGIRDAASDATLRDADDEDAAADLADAPAGPRVLRGRHALFREQVCALAIPRGDGMPDHTMNCLTSLRKG